MGTNPSLMSQLMRVGIAMSHHKLARVTHKGTTEGRHATLERKARRASKHYARPLDCASILSSLPRGLRVA